MKKTDLNSTIDFFGQFVLATEEMICIRGGEDITNPNSTPPVHI